LNQLIAARRRHGAGLLFAAILSLAAARGDTADWTPPPRTQPADPAAIVALSERFPESATMLRRAIAAAIPLASEAQLRVALERLAAMGYALSPAGLQAVAERLPAEGAALTARFEANRTPAGASALAIEIPADRHLIEGLAWDAPRRRLFAASVAGRELLVHDARGWRAVPGVEAGSLFGLAVDAPRNLLWLTSGAVAQTPSPETAFRGLIALDLRTLRVVRRIPAPAGGSPGDLAVAPDGTIYASDPQSGAVYRARPGAAALESLVPAGAMRSPQGLALSPDGSRLYVADYAYGLAVVDLASGRIARVAAQGPAMLDGIDGLVADGATLIAIQNGVSPSRIVRLHLTPDGNAVARVELLERANPAWGEPTLGAIVNGGLLYVADAQWERHGPGGAMTGEGPVRPTAIRILGLRGSGRPPAGLR
jgi:sugar lactone lactonase YvrE